jgi:hypothetical protein
MLSDRAPELRKAPLDDVPDEILERHARTLETQKFLEGEHFVAYVNPHYVSTHQNPAIVDWIKPNPVDQIAHSSYKLDL